MREYVTFKGNKSGLQLVLDDSVDFSVILENLKIKLESAVMFFTNGTRVEVPIKMRVLTPQQQHDLTELLATYGLVFTLPETTAKQPAEAVQEPEEPEETVLVVDKTIRSGQRIVHKGSIIIVGDVNPGSEIIASEDIFIKGACRGVVHAGAAGNTGATITAYRLLATQIRIAGLIARAPDDAQPVGYPERACIIDGQVVIERVDI